MKTLIFNYCVVILLFTILQNTVIAQNGKALKEVSKVTLDGTEVCTLHSKIVKQDYELLIALPKNYHSGNYSYPVLVVLDAYRSFFIMKGCVDIFTIPKTTIPEVIIVGIGYGGDESNSLKEWAIGRTRDLTPVQDSATNAFIKGTIEVNGYKTANIQTGGASDFLEFIKSELYPYLKMNYRIDWDNKILFGYSFGGLFGLYTLFHSPETFNKYLLGSPSIHYKGGITYDFESNYAKTHSDLNTSVFMSSGALEEVTSMDIKKMGNLLRSRNYPHLKLETVIFEDETHTSCGPATISRGLLKLLN